MVSYHFFYAGIFASLVGIAATSIFISKNRILEEKANEEILIGEPISLQISSGDTYSTFSTIIKDDKGKYILCKGPHLPTSEAAALIESEMNDGDNEPIELRGIYIKEREINKKIFKINSVSANGYKIDRYNSY